MKISQPFVLLLGGLLSTSSVGCATINAVVSEHRAASSDKKVSAERMVAIGRVFENQGRYDQAEVMYRRALKKSPSNEAVRDQLQQLVDRKNGRHFEADSVQSAIAMADSINGKGVRSPRVAPVPSKKSSQEAATGRSALASSTHQWKAAEESAERLIDSDASVRVATAVASSAPASTLVTQTSGVAELPSSLLPARSAVSASDILDVIEDPNSHSELLIQGLKFGDTVETQALAAALLGDCDTSNENIREALFEASRTETDPQLRLSIADSQIQRGESTAETAECLISLLEESSSAIRIQASADLRHFAGTPAESKCIAALADLLDSTDDSLRAIGAVTLGDFRSLDQTTRGRLKNLAESDSSEEVRDAAGLAASRIELLAAASFEE